MGKATAMRRRLLHGTCPGSHRLVRRLGPSGAEAAERIGAGSSSSGKLGGDPVFGEWKFLHFSVMPALKSVLMPRFDGTEIGDTGQRIRTRQ